MAHPDGMLTAAGKTDDGRPMDIGTVVRVTGINAANDLIVQVHSGINGTAVIPVSAFRPQPSLVNETDAAQKPIGPRDDVYQEYDSPLWGPAGPEAEDADTQGAIGDCYFMSAMGAVCRSNPDAIKALISPHTPSKVYSVYFYQRDGKGGFQKSPSYSVDSWLPSLRGKDHAQAYGGGIALWVSVLEKAWAMHHGGGSYDAIQGGWVSDAMQSLTGVKSKLHAPEGTDGKGGGVIDNFRQMQKLNKAVCIGTNEDTNRADISWTANKFRGSGDTFSAQLDPSLVFESVCIWSPTFQGKDNANTNILQSGGTAKLKSGSVDYQKGTVDLTFDSATKPNPKDLQVRWSHCGADFQRFGLVGGHAYRFTGVREPDAVNLLNPWGVQHPKPVTADGISTLFGEIASNAVPGATGAAKKAGGATP